MKKLFSIIAMTMILLGGLSLTGSPKTIQAEECKDDITGIDLEKEMREMIAAEVLNGFGNCKYGPKIDVTRGQFATFIARGLDLPLGNQTFPDVDLESKLADGISAASSAGIVTGYSSGLFGPNDKITREQMAMMIQRALKFYDITLEEAKLNFKDVDQLHSSETKRAVATNVYYEIIKGVPQEDGSTIFMPKEYAKRDAAAAVISRLLTTIDNEIGPQPTDFQLASIVKGELTPIRTYSNYGAALSAWDGSNSQVIMNGDHIVKMNTGIAVSVATPSTSLTTIYANESLTAPRVGVTYDMEMKYLESGEDFVKVQYADKVGYVKQEQVKLIPINLLKNRTYYTVQNGLVYHKLYSHLKDSYSAYSVGKAPAFLAEGQQYYSWDGNTFYNTSGVKVGTAYQYFQYLPARTETSYTAAEIDAYILAKLKELEQDYPDNPKYKDASKKSKLIGIGEYLKKVEKEKKINALHILSLAFNESEYGLSPRAQEFNNLFGLRVYDDNPANDYFSSQEENIDELVNEFWNKNYIPPTGPYAYGGAFGNKGGGFNVKYATDPYWGAKNAGHYYRIDQALGGKDFNKYKIGMTNTEGLNIRSKPEVSTSTFLYEYPKAGMPVVILDKMTLPDRTWFKINSDPIAYGEVYAAGEFIDELPTVK
ncbi:S-layer protein [Bacillus sp. AFS015802]|uniref:S-layer homology domain-containing protein n=1 Tax=Bacillus sp. AFS015802 TaxID=2033486 RepID=UPI000BFA7468|nr:S-layer homology domain-containing protein [Bacillus sp. AFS015802]PFA67323.1 S-layer protein [Bacillus sp. AFS015802]